MKQKQGLKSIFAYEVRDANGNLKMAERFTAELPASFLPAGLLVDYEEGVLRRLWHLARNLRTTAGINWQSDVMGSGSQPASARYIGLTEDAGAPAAGDTALTGELAVEGLSRALGAYAHTGGASTYTISYVFTKTGATPRTINKMALFNAAAAGTMPFESLMPNPPVLVAGDTLAVTVTVNI